MAKNQKSKRRFSNSLERRCDATASQTRSGKSYAEPPELSLPRPESPSSCCGAPDSVFIAPPHATLGHDFVLANLVTTGSPGSLKELRIHRRFDLKGSSLGRSSENVEIDESTTLKDLDLNYCFYLEPSWRNALLKQIDIDSKFLETQRIMDYSLLLGVHYRAPQHLRTGASFSQGFTADGRVMLSEEVQEDEVFSYPQGLVLVPRGSNENGFVVGPHIRGRRLRASAAGDEEVDLLLPGTARLQIQLGVNMPARAEHIPKKDEARVFHEVYDVVLYVGIIDILQNYNMGKKIEHAYKSLQFDSVSISAVDPQFYSKRFLNFIQTVFPETP